MTAPDRALAIRAALHDRRLKSATGVTRSVFTLPPADPSQARTPRTAPAFTGPAVDYLPKPDNDPTPIGAEPGDFVMPTQAEINATRLEVERHKRRLLDGAPAPTGDAHR